MPIDPGGETVADDAATGERAAIGPGSRVGKYRLVRLLGRGGMGAVWAAYDPDLEREVALKLLRNESPDPSLEVRFRREARAMARLKHPNVLTVHEVGSADDRDFIAMELVDGSNLDAWLSTQPPRADVWRALIDAGRGLAAAHAAGLVHRDFKPANVLRGVDGRVMVTDFGLARGLEGIDDATRAPITSGSVTALDETIAPMDSPLTMTGALLGTPAYMAPEQFEGAPPDPRTDQFAFCVTAWQALTGARPFSGSSIEELREAASAGKLGEAALPGAVRAALARGLDPDPTKRWPDLDQLLDVLARAAHAPARRRKIAFAAAAGIVGITIVVAVWLVSSSSPAPAVAQAPCTPGEDAFAAAWSTELQTKIESKLPKPHAGFDRLVMVANGYRDHWLADYAKTCEAPTAPTFHARLGCMLAIRDELAALTPVLLQIPGPLFDELEPFGMLPSLSGCQSLSPVIPPAMPDDPQKQQRIIKIRRGSLMLLATPASELPHAIDVLVAEANRTKWLPLVAEVESRAAAALQHHHRLDEARTYYSQSAHHAAAGRHAHVEASARIGVVEVSLDSSEHPNDPNNHDKLAAEANAAIASSGEDPQLTASLATLEARVKLAGGRPDRALELLDKKRDIYTAAGDVPGAGAVTGIEVGCYVARDWEGDLDLATSAIDSIAKFVAPSMVATRTLHVLRGAVAWRKHDLDTTHRELDASGPVQPPDGDVFLVEGVVSGPDGHPVPGATVVAWTGALDGDATRLYTDRTRLDGDVATTDASGHFSIHAPAHGAVIAEHDDLRSTASPVGPRPLAIRLAPTHTVTGTVTSMNDPPTVDAIARFSIGEATWTLASRVRRDGAFTLERVPVGGRIGAFDDDHVHTVYAPATTPIRIAWPATSPLDVIVRGADFGAQIYVLRGHQSPKTMAELRAIVSRDADVAITTAGPIGDETATNRGREVGYQHDDVHAVIDGISDGEVTACATAPDHPPVCSFVVMRTARVVIVSDPKHSAHRGHVWAPAEAVLITTTFTPRVQTTPGGR